MRCFINVASNIPLEVSMRSDLVIQGHMSIYVSVCMCVCMYIFEGVLWPLVVVFCQNCVCEDVCVSSNI